MRSWRLLSLPALLLAGCATVTPPVPAENPLLAWRAREQELSALNTWDVSGRLALHTANDGGTVGLRWVRRKDHYTIDLSGPLGRGMVRLKQDPQGASLEDAERHVYRAANAEKLLLETTGWRIPLDGLGYWIRGLPVPQVPEQQQLDDRGRLRSLNQLGWHIRFIAYAKFGRYNLPSHMILTLAEPSDAHDFSASPSIASNTAVEARLVIERWALLQ